MATQQSVDSSVAPSDTKMGLECRIWRARFAIPVEAVEQIIEYEVSAPPPLASPWVGGLGIHSGRIVLSVSLVVRKEASPMRVARGVLLRAPKGQISWVMEVASTAALVRASISNRRVLVGQTRLPTWISAATTTDGRALGWVNTERMLEELSTPAARQTDASRKASQRELLGSSERVYDSL